MQALFILWLAWQGSTGSQFVEPPPHMWPTWAAKFIKKDYAVVVTYPPDGPHSKVCVQMVKLGTWTVEDEHCWQPKHQVAEMDVWKEYYSKDTYVMVTLWTPRAGFVEARVAVPVEGQDR